MISLFGFLFFVVVAGAVFRSSYVHHVLFCFAVQLCSMVQKTLTRLCTRRLGVPARLQLVEKIVTYEYTLFAVGLYYFIVSTHFFFFFLCANVVMFMLFFW